MNDEVAEKSGSTLLSEIRELEIVCGRLNVLVYGERPAELREDKEPTPADKLTYARNRIKEITMSLKDIANQLEVIGK